MATIYALKPRFQALLRPLAAGLAHGGVSANAVTAAALLLSLVAGLALLLAPASRPVLLALPLVLLVRMALNALDGMLAREHGQASPAGALANELGDVLADGALYLPFGRIPGLPPLLVALVVVLGITGELAGVAARTIGASRRYDGPLGKSDRAFAFGVLALLLGLGWTPGAWSTALLALLAVLALVTVVRRMRRALAEAAPSAPAIPR